GDLSPPAGTTSRTVLRAVSGAEKADLLVVRRGWVASRAGRRGRRRDAILARRPCGRRTTLEIGGNMAIIRIYAGADGASHFEDIHPKFEPRGDQSESAELMPRRGIRLRAFRCAPSNPWPHPPGLYAVFTLSGAVDIEIGDGTVRRLGPGDILIAEDLTGQGHGTREVGPAPRVSIV